MQWVPFKPKLPKACAHEESSSDTHAADANEIRKLLQQETYIPMTSIQKLLYLTDIQCGDMKAKTPVIGRHTV